MMGVAKAWRFSLISANNLALLQNQNGNAISNSNTNKHVCWRSSAATSFQMKPISWSLVCGLMLFGLGLISLFTGHMASDLEWYSQRLVRPSLYSRLDGGRREAIDIWKSKYSKYLYGCSERGRHFSRKIGYPTIGESLEFLSARWRGHPKKFIFDRMTKFISEIFKTSVLGQLTTFFCGAACNKFLFSNENKLITTWWPYSVNKIYPSSTQTSSKEEAKKMRKLLPYFLKPEALQRYISIMDTIANLLQWLELKQKSKD